MVLVASLGNLLYLRTRRKFRSESAHACKPQLQMNGVRRSNAYRDRAQRITLDRRSNNSLMQPAANFRRQISCQFARRNCPAWMRLCTPLVIAEGGRAGRTTRASHPMAVKLASPALQEVIDDLLAHYPRHLRQTNRLLDWHHEQVIINYLRKFTTTSASLTVWSQPCTASTASC
jgi:hypothetical protein